MPANLYENGRRKIALPALALAALAFSLPAAAQDSAVTARGNEPGWAVTIGESEIELLTGNGTERAIFPAPAPEVAGDTTRYAIASEGIVIVLVDEPCTDTMSGMVFPLTATVERSGADTLSGCGGEPASLLTGGEWRVEEIGGQPVVDGSEVTIEFGEDNGVFGNASCNRYRGGWTLTGEGLTIGEIASTMMACTEENLNAQEQSFLAALGSVAGFEIAEDGALVLRSADGSVIVARR